MMSRLRVAIGCPEPLWSDEVWHRRRRSSLELRGLAGGVVTGATVVAVHVDPVSFFP